MKKYIYIILMLPVFAFSQEKVEGIILEVFDGKEVPLAGANVFWLDSQQGDVTDFKGLFELPYSADYDKLVISYVGYKTDTLTISEARKVRHVLKSSAALDEVTVRSRKNSIHKILFTGSECN